jgi:hypothetical protein
MDSHNEPFEVLSIAEVRKKYYWPDEQATIIKISAERIPEPLRCLIPLVERWGISDDTLRLNAMRKASPEEVEYLRAAVARYDDELDEWLAGPEAGSSNPSFEYLAFSNMRMAADGC